jgi:hypothetical protein
MKLIEFPGQNVVFAKDQPEYQPLPAFKMPDDPTGRMACCWKADWKDRIRILITGKIWHEILTFNEPLQPQLLWSDKPPYVQP